MLATDEAALIDSSMSVVAKLSCSSAFTDCPERLKKNGLKETFPKQDCKDFQFHRVRKI